MSEIHQGKALQNAAKTTVGVDELAKRLEMSRSTLYYQLRSPKLDQEFIDKCLNVLGLTYGQVFKQEDAPQGGDKPPPPTVTEPEQSYNRQSDKDKIIALLEASVAREKDIAMIYHSQAAREREIADREMQRNVSLEKIASDIQALNSKAVLFETVQRKTSDVVERIAGALLVSTEVKEDTLKPVQPGVIQQKGKR